jgi:hypothetical protein
MQYKETNLQKQLNFCFQSSSFISESDNVEKSRSHPRFLYGFGGIRFLETTTVSTHSVFLNSTTATATATFSYYHCTPGEQSSAAACTVSFATITLVG